MRANLNLYPCICLRTNDKHSDCYGRFSTKKQSLEFLEEQGVTLRAGSSLVVVVNTDKGERLADFQGFGQHMVIFKTLFRRSCQFLTYIRGRKIKYECD
jgi:hypothetical protein